MLRCFVLSLCFAGVLSMPLSTAFAEDYSQLKEALENRLEYLNDAIDDNDRIVFGKIELSREFLKEGMSDPAVPSIRSKLKSYLPDDADFKDLNLYNADMVAAVKAFQTEKGLDNDGVIGPTTLELINRSLEDEKRIVEINLHRLKQPEWQGRPDLRIDVDIARYHLTAIEDNKVAFEMPVVVGSPQRQTVNFMTVMTGVRLNPGWTLPPTIKEEDYIPKLRENPQWVTDKGVLIYASWDRDAEPIDPMTVDWTFLTDNEIKAMRFYKNAGQANPLGDFRFLMNNKHDIYLHDTNRKSLFEKSDRARSSGCVRVFDPLKIAEFLLKDNPGWDEDKINEKLEGEDPYDVGSYRHIPVYFDYKTAWLNDQDELVLGVDIYGLDDGVYHDMMKSVSEPDANQQTLVNED